MENMVFSANDIEKKQKKLGLPSHCIQTLMDSTHIVDLNVKGKIIKHVEDNVGEYIYNLTISERFFLFNFYFQRDRECP